MGISETADRHLSALAGLDFSYKDVSALLDKIAVTRKNIDSQQQEGTPPGVGVEGEGGSPRPIAGSS